jgi:hypothetical protein
MREKPEPLLGRLYFYLPFSHMYYRDRHLHAILLRISDDRNHSHSTLFLFNAALFIHKTALSRAILAWQHLLVWVSWNLGRLFVVDSFVRLQMQLPRT